MRVIQLKGKKLTFPIAFYVGCYQKVMFKLMVVLAILIRVITTSPYNYMLGKCNVDNPFTGALF